MIDSIKSISYVSPIVEKPQDTKQSDNIKEFIKEVIKEETLTPDKNEVKNLIKALNDLPYFRDKLQFSYSNDIGQSLVQIADKKSGDIIRQYPSEDFIKSVKYYRDNVGILFDERG